MAIHWESVYLDCANYENFRNFLKKEKITFESSGCGPGVHVEILVNSPEISKKCNNFLGGIDC